MSLADLQQTAAAIDRAGEIAAAAEEQAGDVPAAEATKDLTEARAAIALQLKQDKGLRKLIESKTVKLDVLACFEAVISPPPRSARTLAPAPYRTQGARRAQATQTAHLTGPQRLQPPPGTPCLPNVPNPWKKRTFSRPGDEPEFRARKAIGTYYSTPLTR